MDVKKLKVEIIKKLTGKNDINLLLLNGRSEQVKKYSKFNELVNIINSIYEIEDENELKNILKDITELEKDGKLYEIRQIDIESEIREEYASEYNDTATRYDKLSDEELAKIDGVAVFYNNEKRIIVLNGAPFRFLGRAIMGNSGKIALTDPGYLEPTNSSLITNYRPNRWNSRTEFDIYDSIFKSENYVDFRAGDAAKPVYNEKLENDNGGNMVSPEILQLIFARKTGGRRHTHIDLKGKKNPIATMLDFSPELLLDDNPEYRPYDTVYVCNPEPYSEQTKKRQEYFEQENIDDIIKQFNETANPEIFLELMLLSIEYAYDGVYVSDRRRTEFGEIVISKLQKMIDFSKCNNIENLRFINAFTQLYEKLDAGTDLKEVEKKSSKRIKELGKNTKFSIKFAVNKALDEIHSYKEPSETEVMIDFIQSELKKAKERGWFAKGHDIEVELKENKNSGKEGFIQNGKKIQNYADIVRKRQKRMDSISSKLGLSINRS